MRGKGRGAAQEAQGPLHRPPARAPKAGNLAISGLRRPNPERAAALSGPHPGWPQCLNLTFGSALMRSVPKTATTTASPSATVKTVKLKAPRENTDLYS